MEIIELMKEPSERSEKVKELLKEMGVTPTDDVITVDIAEKIATELRGFPKEKMIEVAKGIVGVSKDTAFQIIETAKAYPKKSMGEIRDIVREIRKDGWWESEFRFRPHVSEAMNTACTKMSMEKKALVIGEGDILVHEWRAFTQCYELRVRSPDALTKWRTSEFEPGCPA